MNSIYADEPNLPKTPNSFIGEDFFKQQAQTSLLLSSFEKEKLSEKLKQFQTE